MLVAGGQTIAFREGRFFQSRPASAEIYDPESNRWSTTGPMGFYRVGHGATRLADGRVLVAGGWGDERILKSTEIYDAREDRWISAAPMGVARSGRAATRLPDGHVFVASGIATQTSCTPRPCSVTARYWS